MNNGNALAAVIVAITGLVSAAAAALALRAQWRLRTWEAAARWAAAIRRPTRGERHMLVLTRQELEKALLARIDHFNDVTYFIGLFRNDLTFTADTDIDDIVPADFTGYAGLLPLDQWETGTIEWDPPHARAFHPDVVWTADGGSASLVYGYYVIDNQGALAWGERRSGSPVTVGAAGQTYTVAPVYTVRSEAEV